jgi:hypothetical protein
MRLASLPWVPGSTLHPGRARAGGGDSRAAGPPGAKIPPGAEDYFPASATGNRQSLENDKDPPKRALVRSHRDRSRPPQGGTEKAGLARPQDPTSPQALPQPPGEGRVSESERATSTTAD